MGISLKLASIGYIGWALFFAWGWGVGVMEGKTLAFQVQHSNRMNANLHWWRTWPKKLEENTKTVPASFYSSSSPEKYLRASKGWFLLDGLRSSAAFSMFIGAKALSLIRLSRSYSNLSRIWLTFTQVSACLFLAEPWSCTRKKCSMWAFTPKWEM